MSASGFVRRSDTASPQIQTPARMGLSNTGATLNGIVNPEGLETKYYFEYGTTKAYGRKTAEVSVGSGTSNVEESKAITGLRSSTHVHFEVLAWRSALQPRGASHGRRYRFGLRRPVSCGRPAASLIQIRSSIELSVPRSPDVQLARSTPQGAVAGRAVRVDEQMDTPSGSGESVRWRTFAVNECPFYSEYIFEDLAGEVARQSRPDPPARLYTDGARNINEITVARVRFRDRRARVAHQRVLWESNVRIALSRVIRVAPSERAVA